MDNQNQYDFIMEAGTSTGPVMLQDPKKRKLIAVVFVAVILLIVVIVISIFASLGKKNTAPLVDVAAYQTEIIRITELGISSAADPSIRNQATTLQSFIQSDLSNTTTYIASTGKELEDIEIAAKYDEKVDEFLESATLRNEFDQAFIDVMNETLNAYKVSLQNAINSTSSDEEQELLETAATNIITYEGAQTNSGVSAPFAVTKL